MQATVITATEAARHLGEYLARVKHKGEHFILTKSDRPIAELSPAKGARRVTWGEISAVWEKSPADADFANDLEAVNESDQPEISQWD